MTVRRDHCGGQHTQQQRQQNLLHGVALLTLISVVSQSSRKPATTPCKSNG
jgi:hypothetical protein